MTRHSLAREAACALAALVFAAPLTIASTFADGLAAAPAGSSSSSFGERWIAGRLRLGARFTYDWLEDSRRSGENGYDNANLAGNFLGSLWGLDARQHYFPNPYLEYRVISGVGVGVVYDELRARTLDWADNDEHQGLSGDGDLDIRGIGAYAVGRYRNRSRFEPYGSLGYSWYHSHFHVSPGWAGPGKSFEVAHTQGWFATAGCQASANEHLAIDATFRHAHLDAVAARAYLGIGNHYRAGAFPMRNDSLAIGLTYGF